MRKDVKRFAHRARNEPEEFERHHRGLAGHRQIISAALTLAAAGAFGSFMTCFSMSIASGVRSRAAAFTSATTFLASIVCGRLGRPLKLPLWPRFQEVDLSVHPSALPGSAC